MRHEFTQSLHHDFYNKMLLEGLAEWNDSEQLPVVNLDQPGYCSALDNFLYNRLTENHPRPVFLFFFVLPVFSQTLQKSSVSALFLCRIMKLAL